MRRLIPFLLSGAVLFSACSSAAQTPTPAPTPAPTPTAAPTATPTAAPTATPIALADAGWYALAPEGDGFVARFPAKPQLTTSTTTTKSGPAPTSVWEYLASATLDYNVALWQYPAGSMTGKATGAIYDAAIASLDSANSLTLKTQSDVFFNGHAGRSFTVSGSTYTLRGELVLAGDNLYMAYASYGPTVDTAGVNAFLNDFQLTV